MQRGIQTILFDFTQLLLKLFFLKKNDNIDKLPEADQKVVETLSKLKLYRS